MKKGKISTNIHQKVPIEEMHWPLCWDLLERDGARFKLLLKNGHQTTGRGRKWSTLPVKPTGLAEWQAGEEDTKCAKKKRNSELKRVDPPLRGKPIARSLASSLLAEVRATLLFAFGGKSTTVALYPHK